MLDKGIPVHMTYVPPAGRAVNAILAAWLAMERALTPNGKIGIGDVQAVGDGGVVANWPCHPRLRLMMERALIPKRQ
jgi:hypothetical protein